MLAMNSTLGALSMGTHTLDFHLPQIEIRPEAVVNRRGNSSIVAGVMAIIIAVAVIMMGTIIIGKFTGIASNPNLGLDETWLSILNSSVELTGTTFSIINMIPFALGAGLVIGAIVYVFPRMS